MSIKDQSSSIESRSTLDCRYLYCTHDPLYLQYSLYSFKQASHFCFVTVNIFFALLSETGYQFLQFLGLKQGH